MPGILAVDLYAVMAALTREIQRRRWPAGPQITTGSTRAGVGVYYVTVSVRFPTGRVAVLTLDRGTAEAIEDLVAGIHATIDMEYDREGRKGDAALPPAPPRPAATGEDDDPRRRQWLAFVNALLYACDASEAAKKAAKALLYGMETDSRPTPKIRGFQSSAVIAEWSNPATGAKLEIQVNADATVIVSPWLPGRKGVRDVRCYDGARALGQARKWLAWLTPDADGNDTTGASVDEIMALCEITR